MIEPQPGDRITVPAGHARAFSLGIGTLLTVRQTTGQQVVDLIAFRPEDLTERLSPSHTIASSGRMWPAVGGRFLSNRRTPLLELVEDMVGRHDLTMAACDPWRYRNDYGVDGHRSCSDNFLEVFGHLGIARHELPDPVNLFQNIAYLDSGEVVFRTSLARAGDSVTLRCLVPLLVGLSACPMDLNPISGGRPSDAVAEIGAGNA
jgi:uncharacterized protein YcgI (DUF1989 family)